MVEQLNNSIQSLVVEQVDVQIHRLYQDTRDNWKEVCPTLSHQLPFLTLALKNLEKRKADFQKKQSRSVGAINSVNAGYSSVGQQTKPNRFISSDKGGRIDNQTSVVSTVSTDIRGHNQARTRYQGFDKDNTQLREESLDVSHRGNPKSSRNSSESTKKGRKLISRFYPKRRHNKYRRGRGILSSGSRSWNAILFRIRHFSKFLYKPSDQYSDTQQTTVIDPPIGTVTNLRSVSAEINQPGIDSLSEYIGTASEKGLAYRQVNESGMSNSIQEYNKGVEENILVNDPTASQHNSRRGSVASNRGKCTEQPIHSLTGVDQPSQSSPSVPRIEHHRESTCSAEGIQQSSEHLHADFPTQMVEKKQTIIKGRPESKRRSGGGFFGSRNVHEGSRPDNSTGHRHRRDQAKQTEVLLASGTDSENSANPGVGKSNPVVVIKGIYR
jgi:hypothetical protein